MMRFQVSSREIRGASTKVSERWLNGNYNEDKLDPGIGFTPPQ